MKKLVYLFILFISFTAVMTACSKDEVNEPFKIVKNTVNYSPLSSEGILEFNSADFTVRVEDDWCNIEKIGNQVKVSFSDNSTEINRSTLIHVTPNDGQDPVVVPITQVGLLFEINTSIEGISYSLNGGVKKINIIRNIDYTVETDQPWLTHEIVGDTLYLKAEPLKGVTDPNFSREAKATIKYGDRKVEFSTQQYTIYDYNDFLGDAYISYINDASKDESKRVRVPVKIEGKVEGKTFTIVTAPLANMSNLPVKIDVNINPDNTLEIATGQLLASNYNEPTNAQAKRIYVQAYNIAQKAFCGIAGSFLKASAKVGNGQIDYDFVPNGQFNNNALLTILMKYYDADGLAVTAHRDQNISTSSRLTAVPVYLYLTGLRIEK